MGRRRGAEAASTAGRSPGGVGGVCDGGVVQTTPTAPVSHPLKCVTLRRRSVAGLTETSKPTDSVSALGVAVPMVVGVVVLAVVVVVVVVKGEEEAGEVVEDVVMVLVVLESSAGGGTERPTVVHGDVFQR